jgi:fructan beta-fructosidase
MKILKAISIILLSYLTTGCGAPAPRGDHRATSHYHEPFRPQFHFSPDSMWTNDPNGLVFFEGEYHLFYQYHPYDIVWGPMHWGHAVSRDLVRWTHLPVALYPDTLGMIFSGCAVVDRNNTSGLGDRNVPPLVAVFTYHNERLREKGSNRFQYQGIAFSPDKGRSWTKFGGNPVLQNPGISDFRDPKVIWYEKEMKWVMTLAAHDRVLFYSSPDLVEWTGTGEFTDELVPSSAVWECPDLFPLNPGGEEKWVLIVNVSSGGPNGGSGTLYFAGSFDGSTFRDENLPPGPRWIDYGKDNYAGVTWSGIPSQDGRRIFLGWMSNWQYADRVPTQHWRGAMTLPRELELVRLNGNYRLYSRPVSELKLLRQSATEISGQTFGDTIDPEGITGLNPSQFEMDMAFECLSEGPSGKAEGSSGTAEAPGLAAGFGIALANDLNQQLLIGYDRISGQVYVDRTNAGVTSFSEHFPGRHTAPFQPENDEIRFHIFVDRSSVELFLNRGALVMTEIVFPEGGFTQIRLYASGGPATLKEGTIYNLEGIW